MKDQEELNELKEKIFSKSPSETPFDLLRYRFLLKRSEK
jgi:hypothetical protein